MPLNPTENYLRDRRDHVLLNFAGALGTTTRYLTGAGNYVGDGYPMPAPGKAVRLFVYDGANVRTTTLPTSFNQGDRLCLLAQYDAPWFQVTLRINNQDTGTYVNQVAANSNVQASLLVQLAVY